MDDFVVSREEIPSADKMALKQRACCNCARLKMKCQWSNDGAGRPEKTCSRCARMKLSCQVPDAAPRKKRGKSTRVAQLEKKLDGIVELLAASQQIQAKGPSPLTPESPKASQSRQPSVSGQAYPTTGPIVDFEIAPSQSDLIPNMPFDAPILELFPGFRITQAQAARHLDVYRRDFLDMFPFVPFQDSLTACDLYTRSRFLFWTVMSVVVPLPGPVQSNVRTWFRKYLAEHVIVRQEKRLDMLQAILVHLAWNDFPFYLEPQATPLFQVAMSLVIDLRLDRSPASFAAAQKALLGDAWGTINRSQCGPKLKTVHTLDEKRAVLGYYHLSNLLSKLFRRGVGFAWSNFLGQCCDSLLAEQEYPSDQFLVATVRLQQMAERAYAIMRGTDFQDQVSIVFRAPLDMAINNARRELDSFAKSQPDSVRNNKMFQSHHHIILIRLYEPVLMMKSPPISDTDSLAVEPFLRSEALWKCLECTMDFYKHQLAIPAGDFANFPVTSGGFMAFSVVTASRLLFLDASSPDWDSARARRRLDLADVLKRLSDQCHEADQAAADMHRRRRILDDGTSMLVKYSFKARWIRQWYLAKAQSSDDPHQPPPALPMAQQPQSSSSSSSSSEPLPEWPAEFQFDEDFWQELMNMHDCDLSDLPLTNAAPLQL